MCFIWLFYVNNAEMFQLEFTMSFTGRKTSWVNLHATGKEFNGVYARVYIVCAYVRVY